MGRIVIDEDTGNEFVLRATPEYYAEINAYHDGWCQHPATELRRRTIAGGRIVFSHQCLTCGRFPGNAVPKPADADGVPDADATLRDRYDAERAAGRREIEQCHVRLQKSDWAARRQWYDQYLNSPAWWARRQAVMDRARGICEGCRTRPAAHVHHLTYDHVGNELLWELVAVCEQCHARCHPDKQEAADD